MKNKLFTLIIMWLICELLFQPHFVFAQSNENCIFCHSDNLLSHEKKGKTISLFVDERKFSKSVHGLLDCVNCHENFDSENIPHKDGANISEVSCAKCHSVVVASFKQNIHYKLVSNKKEILNCKSCHSNHEIKQINSISDKSKNFCSKCHSDKKIVGTFHKLNISRKNNCKECHKEYNYIKNKLSITPHKNIECSYCHEYVANNFIEHLKIIPIYEKASCKNCHTEINEICKTSINSDAINSTKSFSAKCWECHGSHGIKK